MDRDDLEVLVIGQPGSDQATALLFDPMPGGSGLLQQIVARFKEVIDAASAVALGCSGGCERSCIDCLQTFRNAYYHKHLNRKLVCEKLELWGSALHPTHPIPAKTPNLPPSKSDLPVNDAEARLRMLLDKAGFPEAEWHKQIKLGHPLGSTSPDGFYPDEDGGMGTCLYLDGLSQHIHGHAATRQRDLEIREELDGRGYNVLRIVATDLWDVAKMSLHFSKLGKLLIGKEHARKGIGGYPRGSSKEIRRSPLDLWFVLRRVPASTTPATGQVAKRDSAGANAWWNDPHREAHTSVGEV